MSRFDPHDRQMRLAVGQDRGQCREDRRVIDILLNIIGKRHRHGYRKQMSGSPPDRRSRQYRVTAGHRVSYMARATRPRDNLDVAVAAIQRLTLENHRLRGSRRSRKEHQAKLARLDFVAVGRHHWIHRLAVDVGAVEAADVNDPDFAAVPSELGMAAADGDVVEEDVAARVPPGGVTG